MRRKRFFALLLAVVMTLCAFPVSALAAGGRANDDARHNRMEASVKPSREAELQKKHQNRETGGLKPVSAAPAKPASAGLLGTPGTVATIGKYEFTSLEVAFAEAKDGETVTLAANVVWNGAAPIVISGKAISFDCGGYQLTVETPMFNIEAGAKLTLVNANIADELPVTYTSDSDAGTYIPESGGGVIQTNAGTLVLESTAGDGIVIGVSGDDQPEYVFVFENVGEFTVNGGQVLLNNGYFVLANTASGKVSVNDIVTRCEENWLGYTAVVEYSHGSVELKDGDFQAEAIVDYMYGDAALNVSGGTYDTYYGILYSGDGASSAVIKNAVCNSDDYVIGYLYGTATAEIVDGTYVSYYIVEDLYENSSLTIHDGDFTGDSSIIEYLDDASSAVIENGKFEAYEILYKCYSGTASLEIKNGTFNTSGPLVYGLQEEGSVSFLAGTYTCEGAFVDEAGENTTVTFKGGTYNSRVEDGSDYYGIDDISGHLVVSGGKFTSTYSTIYLYDSAKAEISGGEFTSTGDPDYPEDFDYAMDVNGGEATLSGGTFICAEGHAPIDKDDSGILTIAEGYHADPADWEETGAHIVRILPDIFEVSFVDETGALIHKESLKTGERVAEWPETPEKPDLEALWWGWVAEDGTRYVSTDTFYQNTVLSPLWLHADGGTERPEPEEPEEPVTVSSYDELKAAVEAKKANILVSGTIQWPEGENMEMVIDYDLTLVGADGSKLVGSPDSDLFVINVPAQVTFDNLDARAYNEWNVTEVNSLLTVLSGNYVADDDVFSGEGLLIMSGGTFTEETGEDGSVYQLGVLFTDGYRPDKNNWKDVHQFTVTEASEPAEDDFVKVATLAEFLEAAAGTAGRIIVTAEIPVTETIYIDRDLVIDSEGGVLYRGEVERPIPVTSVSAKPNDAAPNDDDKIMEPFQYNMLSISPEDSDNPIVVTINDLVLDGRNLEAAAAALYVDEGATVYLKNTTVKNNYCDSYFYQAGGIYTAGDLYLYDGDSIFNNKAPEGGGIGVSDGSYTGHLFMLGGEIYENAATTYGHSGSGGGVKVGVTYSISRWNTPIKFYMSGGKIHHNSAYEKNADYYSQAHGGGVSLGCGDAGIYFLMNGGEITDNVASGWGGGLYTACAGAYMFDGLIARNTADERGGGVATDCSCQKNGFYMYGGTVTLNASAEGGGLYVTGKYLVLGEVYDNLAEETGDDLANPYFSDYSPEDATEVTPQNPAVPLVNPAYDADELSDEFKALEKTRPTAVCVSALEGYVPQSGEELLVPFFGWFTDDEDSYRYVENQKNPLTSSEETLKPTVDIKAIYKGYFLVYDANNGSGDYNYVPEAFAPNTETLVDFCSYTKEGYHFIGWNTEADGSGLWYYPQVKDHDSILMDENKVLFAQYERDYGTLIIEKSFEGVASMPAETSFTITGPSDFAETTVEYREFSDGKYVLENIPGGDYTVKENTDNAQIPGMTLTVSGDQGKTKTLLHKEEVAFSIQNIYKAMTFTVDYSWSGAIPEGVTLPTDGSTYYWHDMPEADKTYSASTTIEGTKDGVPGTYSFSGWDASEDADLTAEGMEGNVTFKGVWTFAPDGYTVNYEWSGAIPSGVTLPTDGSTYYWHDTPEADKTYSASTSIDGMKGGILGTYRFSGWDASADPDLTAEGMEGNVTFKGVWTFTPNEYAVDYKWSGDVPSGVTLPTDGRT